MAKESKSVDSKKIDVVEGSDVDSSAEVESNNLKNDLNQLVNSGDLLQEFEQSQLKGELPEIYVGDLSLIHI